MTSKGNTATLFIEAGYIIKTRMQKALPMPLSQCQTLNFIAKDGQPNMQDIARYFKIRAPSATLLVDELARAGLVERKASARDRRKVEIALTAKGKRVAKQVDEVRTKVLGSIFDKLSEQDRKQLDRILEKVISSN